MIKRLRVTVDGNAYDVTVEVSGEATPTAPAAPVISAPTPPATAAPVTSEVLPVPAPTAAPAPKPASKPVGASGPGDVLCPLAGRVAAVVVQLGQAVQEGDHLVTLEAMKMNTFVFAPKSGKVAALNTEVGAVVEEGQVLATIG